MPQEEFDREKAPIVSAPEKEAEAIPAEEVEGEAETEAETVTGEEVREAEVEKPPDELEALRQQLEEARSKADEYLDQWRRTAAEFANYKKRNEKEQAEFTKYANAALITTLLPLLDDFERAFQTLPGNLRDLTWIDGILLIQRKLQMIFEQVGVTVIKTEDQVFDPILHEAVTYEESVEREEGQIIGEVQKGYKLHDRVLRPALVRVSKGQPEVESQKEAEEGEKATDED